MDSRYCRYLGFLAQRIGSQNDDAFSYLESNEPKVSWER